MANLDTQTQYNAKVMKGLLGVEQLIPITLSPIDRKITNLKDRFVKQYGQGNKIEGGREYFIDGKLVRVNDNIEIYTTREEPYQDFLNFIDNLSENINVRLMIEA